MFRFVLLVLWGRHRSNTLDTAILLSVSTGSAAFTFAVHRSGFQDCFSPRPDSSSSHVSGSGMLTHSRVCSAVRACISLNAVLKELSAHVALSPDPIIEKSTDYADHIARRRRSERRANREWTRIDANGCLLFAFIRAIRSS